MNKSLYIAKGGMLTALSVILLYLSFILPTNKLTLLTLSSLIIPVAIITMNIKSSILVYASTSTIIFLLGLKSVFILYLLIFGPYGIIKLYIERLKKSYIEIILKLLYFNITLSLLYLLSKALLFQYINIDFPLPLIVLLLQIGIFIYDYALTLLINLFQRKILKK